MGDPPSNCPGSAITCSLSTTGVSSNQIIVNEEKWGRKEREREEREEERGRERKREKERGREGESEGVSEGGECGFHHRNSLGMIEKTR